MAKGIDGYLTEKVQEIWPDAIVKWEHSGEKDWKGRKIERWYISRPNQEDLDIGKFFNGARQSVNALLRENKKSG